MPFVVGLTGGIASGKTTVADLFHEHFQIEIVDADIVAREVVEPGSEGLNAIAERYGETILTAEHTLDRAKLREIIFSTPEEKEWVNGLLHPMIREKMQNQLQAVSSPYALLVIPLMVENNLQSMADRILVVDVSPETQIRRTMQRDSVPETQVKAILASQADRKQRLAIANDVILNDGDKENLLSQITQLHQKYLSLSAEQTTEGS